LSRHDHILLCLTQLQWLPVRARIQYNLCSLMYGVHNNRCPSYVFDVVRSTKTASTRGHIGSAETTDYVLEWCTGQVMPSRARPFPPYLSDNCQLVTDVGRRHLRSADVHTCTVPRTQSRLGDRSFGVAGPRLWNSLPVELLLQDICLTEFRRLLDIFLFAETRRIVTLF